ncbi:major facilitator superfamily domain-containing protein [Hypoxylon cercidicola]|nr:major facilitator superfamily domain-containing protein [Hypoxylon cercidicola]
MAVVDETMVAGGLPQSSSEEQSPQAQETPTLRDKLRKPIKFHLAFLSLLLMVLIVSIDATALGIAIPTISNELHGTTLEAFWASISFILIETIVQPIYTSVSDVLGRKLPLYVAFALFAIGSIVFAVSQSLPVVIVGRVVQVLGGGGLNVLNEVIIADITALNERAFYIGLISIPMALDWSQSAATLSGSFIHGLILYTLIQYIPLFFQSVFLKGPLPSAVSMISFFAVLMGFTAIAALGVEWTRRYRWEIWLGWVFAAVGVGLLGLWGSDTTLAESSSFQVIAAIGLGTLFTVPPIPMQASAKRVEDQGLAIGILVSFRLFGALIGLCIAATVFSNEFGAAIASLGPLPAALTILESSEEALGFIPYLQTVNVASETMESVRGVYAQAFKPIFYILAGFGVVGFLTSLLSRELIIESEEKGRQAFQN